MLADQQQNEVEAMPASGQLADPALGADDAALVGNTSQRGETETEDEYDGSESSSNYDSASTASFRSQESFLRRRLRKHFQTGIPLYKRPVARYRWGQKQAHAHHVWASLFFDLAYVGVAFQLGHLMSDGVKEDRILASLGLFIAIFTSLEMCWQNKLGFDSRYIADDVFHRIHQIVAGSLVSLSANSIASLEIMENTEENSHTLTLSCCLLLFQAVDLIPYVEMTRSKVDNVRAAAYVSCYTRICVMLVYGASVVTSIYAPLWVTALLWFLGGNSIRFFIFFIYVTGTVGKARSVPMHVNWAIHRYTEFLLLMIGESIISIIIVGYSSSANFIVTFLLCYCLVATLALLIFATGVEDDDKHAFRRSTFRAIGFIVLTGVQSMTLILTGVAFKLILTSPEKIPEQTYVWFMSTALASCLMALLIGRVQHHGLREEFCVHEKSSRMIKKFLLWTCKLILVGVIFAASPMNAPGYGLIIWYLGITLLVFLVQMIDLRVFEQHHTALVEKEVQDRIKKLKSEGIEVDENYGKHGHFHDHDHGHSHEHNHMHSDRNDSVQGQNLDGLHSHSQEGNSQTHVQNALSPH